jgi:hypothetical protein
MNASSGRIAHVDHHGGLRNIGAPKRDRAVSMAAIVPQAAE